MAIKDFMKTPVVILGGEENALSIVRNLGKKQIPVYVSSHQGCTAHGSKYCDGKYPVRDISHTQKYWGELLLGGGHPALKGSVLLPCSDDALMFLAENRESLEREYILHEFIPGQVRELLDKQKTLELAESVGVPIPKFWNIQTISDVKNIKEKVLFPVLLKPIHSHLFQRSFPGRKYFMATDFSEMIKMAQDMLNEEVEFMISEFIPGPDHNAVSYYTYVNNNNDFLYHYTKGVKRRYPVNQGGATYHYTKWMPNIAELGENFLRGIGYRGIANVEFKYDERDGKYKIIECNSRFSASHEIQVKAGMEICYMIYRQLTGQTVERVEHYREDATLWFPVNDFKAFCRLRSRGDITFNEWMKDVARKNELLYPSLSDPVPTFLRCVYHMKKGVRYFKRKFK